MPLYHHNDLSILKPEARRVILFIIRELAKLQMPEVVAHLGLEKAEECIVKLIKAKKIRLCCDRATEQYWFEKVEA